MRPSWGQTLRYLDISAAKGTVKGMPLAGVPWDLPLKQTAMPGWEGHFPHRLLTGCRGLGHVYSLSFLAMTLILNLESVLPSF